jgi:truncated hemoglobin YjbI
MKSAVDQIEMKEELRKELWNYLEMAAHSMVNQPRGF